MLVGKRMKASSKGGGSFRSAKQAARASPFEREFPEGEGSVITAFGGSISGFGIGIELGNIGSSVAPRSETCAPLLLFLIWRFLGEIALIIFMSSKSFWPGTLGCRCGISWAITAQQVMVKLEKKMSLRIDVHPSRIQI
jgi:hypothetical protein